MISICTIMFCQGQYSKLIINSNYYNAHFFHAEVQVLYFLKAIENLQLYHNRFD